MQELPLIRLTFREFRRILERCKCRFAVLAQYGELHDTDGAKTPALYLIEFGENDDKREAILHIWDDEWPVPLNDIRAVCAVLGLDLSIFDTIN